MARAIWQCNQKYKSKNPCGTPHIYEDVLKAAFVECFKRVLADREQLVENYDAILQFLTDTEEVDTESVELQNECNVVMEMLKKSVEENAAIEQDQDEYQRRYDALVARYESANARLEKLSADKQRRTARRRKIQDFRNELLAQATPLIEWDEEIWYNTVDSVTVYREGSAEFIFRDGSNIKIDL